jgi:hypothetical protein
MFDVARVIALIVAGSSCFRPRYILGVVVVLALLVLDGPSMVIPVVRRGEAPPNAFYAFALLFWGPSSLPTSLTRWTLIDVLGAHPAVRTAGTSALAWAASAMAFARAKPLRPESVEARVWDRVGLRFLFVAVFDALLFVSSVMLDSVGRE